jgi:hypothetical protein
VIGYADGYFGYVADPEAYRVGGYEAASSLFDADGARLFFDSAIGLLQRTFDDLTTSRRAHA